MQHSAKIRLIAAGAFLFATLLSAQTPPAQPVVQPPLTTSQQPAHQAEVTYTGGKLFVSASNSSLNQILRDISRQTGMKITGGVNDERVFGQYGPSAPAIILNTLLDGTGSNMLLLQATATTPAELVLTPRHGGPTPPSPSAFEDSQANRQPPPRPQYSEPAPEETNQRTGEAEPPRSSDIPRTPQQIYEQLQRMRQQQQQQQSQQPQQPSDQQ